MASSFAFFSIPMHGHVNATLPIVAELVRRGDVVTYHATPAFAGEIAATGATVLPYAGGEQRLPDPPTPAGLVAEVARISRRVLPGILADLDRNRPDAVVFDSACLWGLIAARVRDIPSVCSYTTFAFNDTVPSPVRFSWSMLKSVLAQPGELVSYAGSRAVLQRRYPGTGVPLVDIGTIRGDLNLVYTSRRFQPGTFDDSYKFVGPSLGARPHDFEPLPSGGPFLYASLGTVFDAGPAPLRLFAEALAPLGGTVIISTGSVDPAALGPLPANVIARRSVPQLEVLDRASLFVTHGGMNSVNESLAAGVPMLVIPQGADQPLVAERVTTLGAGLSITPAEVTTDYVRSQARRLLQEPRFRESAAALAVEQREAGGYRRAADELQKFAPA
ncbi:hypothetical protein M1L60_14745 [Actinoplanes sp. TRM 88003]|uniref:Erythromycin biosynthesis protein CIII-like C-terminal domain-containing protein n=1 Tax=Paractinoplanes aksuensis TaxID=2939490 RepID=A0ABT1DLY6_9ACTN|nr:macrolide family glycosyltransferase [Actinoplanes aksuensis]MCO8271854.1 hypothetical protein [Actinoplanes aksuensis]